MYERLIKQFLLCLVLALTGVFPLMAENESVEDIEGTVRGAMRMTLYDATTTTTDNPTNDIHVSLGDTIAIDVWLQNSIQQEITSISFYFTVDGNYFEPVALGRYANDELIVFDDGYFMTPAQPTTITPIGNYTHHDINGPDDNGIAGWQLDYFSYAEAPVTGSEQRYSNYPEGVACTFYLVAKAVCDSVGIAMDYTPYNQRFTRYGIRGSNDTFTFRTYQTCYITVSGLAIEPPLPDLFMEPDSADSTSLDLDDHVDSGAIPDSEFDWSVTGNTNILTFIDPLTHEVTFIAPAGFRGYEDITFTLSNENDPEIDTDTMRVTVGSQPRLLEEAIPDTITIYEDSTHVAVLYLPDIVEDADNAFETLTWQFTTSGGNVIAEKQNTVLNMRAVENFFGSDSLYIRVTDDMQLSDSDTVFVRVLPVNDAPVLSGLPDATFERTESYEFDLSEYASDVDNDPLQVSWSDPDSFFIDASGMNITITEADGFLGTREVIFTVQDPSGLADSDTMLVTVTPKSDPPVWSPIPKLGFAQDGMFSDLILWDYVEDPDGADKDLTFTFTGYDDVDSIRVDPADGRLFMYDLDDTIGWDWVTVTARDVDNNTASTRFLVFVAPKDGTPIVGAIPDTTMRAGRPLEWIDLDNYYYDIDHTDGQMKWTWSHNVPDTLVYADIHNLFRTVTLYTYNPDSTGIDNLRFTVTDPDNKTAYDDCLVTVLGETKPLLDMPPKVGFIAGSREVINLDDYTEDPVYEKDELTWQWWGNTDIEAGYSTADADSMLSRPFYFTSDSTYIGWEKMFFKVQNPLSGSASDSTIVFSVSSDGSPLAGGLEYVYIHAGYCDSMNIDLDNYYYDADTFDWGVNWEVTGNDSVLVSIDPITHRAEFCSPSETFEGQEIITLTVSDGINQSSMDVAVIVYGAVYRDVFSMDIYRNPMQNDYMDLYLESSKELFGTPKVEIRVDRTGEPDTTFVSMRTLVDSTSYYHGQYLLPYESSLGIQRDAVVIATGTTKNSKAVEDTLDFSYGRFGSSGGKLALGKVSLHVPSGALATPATITIIPDRGGTGESAAKSAPAELIMNGVPYMIGPAGLMTDKPMQIQFDLCCRADGAGIYRTAADGWEFVPGVRDDAVITADVLKTGTYRLAFDRTAPTVTLASAGGGIVQFAVADGGSGIDPGAVTVTVDGAALTPVYDAASGRCSVTLPGYMDTGTVTLAVTVADRAGNSCEIDIETAVETGPGMFTVWQNVPNPFNPRTVIPFAVPAEGRVKIEVYDVLGRRVKVLADGAYPAGVHRVTWDASDDRGRRVSSGIYLYRVTAGDAVRTRKMMLMR